MGIKRKSDKQKQIDREVAKLKLKWYYEKPICIMCLKQVYWGRFDLMHKIRKSETSKIYSKFELQTMKLNTGPSHRKCHTDFDDDKEAAKTYPGFKQIMKDIKEIDIDIYNKMTYLWTQPSI